MTAYAYLRKSVVHQDDPHNSAEAQEAAVRAMATRYGENGSLMILSDWDKSGRLGRAKRPGYDRLWQAIESGEATAIYSYSMSRLARSVGELVRLFEACQERSIPVRLHADVVDTSTASGRMTATILASVAAFEADVAGERMRASMQAKAARGERVGTVAFYGDHDGEDTDAVLAAFREAGSYSGAAKLLNERGVKPRGSRRGWWPSSVQVVVRRLDPSVNKTERGVKAGKKDFLLARLLRCPTCGTSLTGTRDRDGRRVRYSCRLGTALPHPRISITESLVLPAVKAEVARLVLPETVGLASDEGERSRLEARRTRWLEMFADGLIDKRERDTRLRAISDALAAMDTRSELLTLPTITWTEPIPEINAVLRALFEKIDLDPETFQPVKFEWAVPGWRA
ncbi:MAG: recombinase family protein [Candidatus Limnocylindrales bacterium]|jgi:DNA invertase Pin-like site-specific DNA recombinase